MLVFWKKEEAKGRIPGPHKEHEGIPVDVGRKLVPIFQRLTENNLLQRCKRGATQNQNESLHSVIWRFCPKLKTMLAEEASKQQYVRH